MDHRTRLGGLWPGSEYTTTKGTASGLRSCATAELKARAAARRMSLSDYLAKELERLVAQPTLDEVLDRLARQPRRQLAVGGADLVHEARAEAGLDG